MAANTPKRLEAQEAIDEIRRRFSEPEPEWYASDFFGLETDFERLKCETEESRLKALQEAVRQISVEAAKTPKPPGLGTDRQIRGVPVYEFVFDCSHFGIRMFFRFAFSKSNHLYIVSIHPADF